MPLTRVERSHTLAALLRKDYGTFTTVVEKTQHLPQRDKVSLLASVLRYQSGDQGDGLDVEEILTLINGASST
jgi:hypothetical protein